MSWLKYVEALKIKQALNASALEPDTTQPCRMLTPQELADLTSAVDRATIHRKDCGHLAWEWPQLWCPSCGSPDMGAT